MVSAVETKLNGVSRSSLALFFSQLAGRSEPRLLVAHAHFGVLVSCAADRCPWRGVLPFVGWCSLSPRRMPDGV